MALDKNFSNTVPDRQEKVKEIEKLTQLSEGDEKSIYNMIFVETTKEHTDGN